MPSGGFSGGISSSIAGGNFWSGAREGLITSGLNHAMHTLFQSSSIGKFEKEVKKAYGNNYNDRVTNPSTNLLDDMIERVPTLKKYHSKFIKKYSKYSVNYVDTMPRDGADGKFFYDSLTINIYRGASSSYLYMANVILHEMGHMNSYYNGFYQENLTKYNNNINIAISIDEIYVHKFVLHNGGTNYNTWYYGYYSNKLKESIWKIDAEKIKMPTYD